MLRDPVATSASRTASRQRPRLVTRTRHGDQDGKGGRREGEVPLGRRHIETADLHRLDLGPAIPPVIVSASTKPRRTSSAKASVAMAR